jgi:hypothetical protein
MFAGLADKMFFLASGTLSVCSTLSCVFWTLEWWWELLRILLLVFEISQTRSKAVISIYGKQVVIGGAS